MDDTDRRNSTLRWLGLGASLVWAVTVIAYGVGYLGTRSPGGLSLLVLLIGLLVAIVLPVAAIWAILGLIGAEARHLAAEKVLGDRIARLEAEVRKLSDIKGVPAHRPAPEPSAKQPEQPLGAPPETVAEPAPDEGEEQPVLPFGDGGEDGFTPEETIRALNFPQDAQDKAGFDILARALARHDLAQILQASEDCLNYLAHLGLYMDDLMPARGTARDWRNFAEGGPARAALLPLTGITDQTALAKVRAEMRADPIFRDAGLHFQRRFDRMLHDFAPQASDAELLDLIDTRTGRAFILLAQVSGTLDG